jgi:hypothetical protein
MVSCSREQRPSAWVNKTHWVVVKFTGTFTVNGQAQTFSKTYGHKTGLFEAHDASAGRVMLTPGCWESRSFRIPSIEPLGGAFQEATRPA